MFFNKFDKASGYICLNTFAKWWIKPHTFSWSVFSFCPLMFFVKDFLVISTAFEGFVVVVTYIVELLFTAASAGYSFRNHLRYLSCDVDRVVGVLVYVADFAVRFTEC